MQQNQVYVIQVNTNNGKIPLALPAPSSILLPSEVKYSASLVLGLGGAHLVLGTVLFLLGVLGSWVEPETCWSGAGVWGGIATLICGTSGVLAYHLWYKNYTIKAFLVSSVVCFVISILAIILIIYALVNRHEQFYNLIQEAESKPWFKPYNTDQEHQLTVSVSANLLVGFVMEFLLSVWSVKIGWKGVRAEEFSSNRRDAPPDDLQSIVSTTQHNGQQVPLAALYQLLQAHPELLGSKAAGGSLGPPWLSSLDDRPSHRSMDYQERVSRFLSHAIEDQNPSFSRSPSTIQEDIQENPSPNGGRGSPSSSADTAVVLPDTSQLNPIELGPSATSEKTGKVEDQHIAKIHTMKVRSGEPKSRAPNPKEIKEIKEKEYRENKISEESEIVLQDDNTCPRNNVSENSEEKEQKTKKKSKEKISSATESKATEDREKTSTFNRDTHQSSQTERLEKQKNKKEREHGKTNTDNSETDHSASVKRHEKQTSKNIEQNDDGVSNNQSNKSEIEVREQDHLNTNNPDQKSKKEKHKGKSEREDDVSRNDVDQSNECERTEKEKSKRVKELDKTSKKDVDLSKQSERTEKEKIKREKDHVSKNDVDPSKQSERIEKHKHKKEKERDQVSTKDVNDSKHSERTEKQKNKKDKEQEEMNTGNVDESKQLEKSEKKKRKKEKEQNEAGILSIETHQSEDAEKSEKHRSRPTKEKLSHAKEQQLENKDQDIERREKKKHKKNEKHGKSKSQTSVTNEGAHSDIPEVVSTDIKNNANKSESTVQNKDVSDHSIALKPPNEFQDVDLQVKS